MHNVPGYTLASLISRTAALSTMLRTVNRLIALSFPTQREQLEQRTKLTWPRPFLLRPLFLLFLVCNEVTKATQQIQSALYFSFGRSRRHGGPESRRKPQVGWSSARYIHPQTDPSIPHGSLFISLGRHKPPGGTSRTQTHHLERKEWVLRSDCLGE